MKRKRRLILWISLVVFGAYALITGGVAVSTISDFGGQRNIQLAEGLKADAWLAPESTSFGVPFVFHYYGAEGPFGLWIQVWDENKQYRTLEVSEVVLEYEDGEIIRNNETWSRQLTPYIQHNSTTLGIVKTEMFMLSDQIEEVVLRHTDVKITLRGLLIEASGEQTPFETSEVFTAESRFEPTAASPQPTNGLAAR